MASREGLRLEDLILETRHLSKKFKNELADISHCTLKGIRYMV